MNSVLVSTLLPHNQHRPSFVSLLMWPSRHHQINESDFAGAARPERAKLAVTSFSCRFDSLTAWIYPMVIANSRAYSTKA